MILLYNILMLIVILILFPFIFLGGVFSEKRRKTVLQRIGISKLPERLESPAHQPIWIHALSVGEVLSAAPLVKAIKEKAGDRPVCFSASTKTGFEIAEKRLSQDTDGIFFFPYDLFFSVRHRISQVNPCAVVLIETDIWPNFLHELDRKKIPISLVNARLSDRSFSGYSRFFWIFRPLFLTFSKICVQSNIDAKRFRKLGIPETKIKLTGNIKFHQAISPVSESELLKMKDRMKIRPEQIIFLAGSTHQEDETVLLTAFSSLKETWPDLLLIIAPRNPERSSTVRRMFSEKKFSSFVLQEVENMEPDKNIDVIVVDRIGMLSTLYAISDISFIGGSFGTEGGHNPLEPAVYSKPILFGPDMSDFREISMLLLEAGGAKTVSDPENLCYAVSRLIEKEDSAIKMGKQAFAVFSANRGAVHNTLKEIKTTWKA
ncbi:MAG: 3-deoxy-D-manno-octulosonic acid transferase [Deltaproteobacteria bacterium]|nr:3-deoxy-D-manno-octulosonic acid transferase [Deltaproteobacteria bacterium]